MVLIFCISTVYKNKFFAHKTGGNHPLLGAISTSYQFRLTPSERGVAGLLKKLAPIVFLTLLLGALWGGSNRLLLTLL